MHVRKRGAGRPVLLLHASPFPAAHLDPVAELLAPHRRVLVPDMPGYGQSATLDGVYSYDRVTDLLVGELTACDVTEVDVVGYSLGTYRAFALALSGRIRVATIVSLSGFAGLDQAAAQGYRDLAAGLRSGAVTLEALAPITFAPGYLESHPEEAEECRGYLRSAPMATVIAEMDALAEAEDLRPRLSGLRTQVVVRVGALDQAIPIARSHEIVEAVPGARLQIVPGCGHTPLFEDRDGTLAAIGDALGLTC